MRHPYDVPAFGGGEVWVRDGVVVQHELLPHALCGNEEHVWRSELPIRSDGRAPAAAAAEMAACSAAAAAPREATTRQPAVGPTEAKPFTATPTGGPGRPERTLPAEQSPPRADSVSTVCQRAIAHLSGIHTSYEDITVDLAWATPLQRAFVDAARAIPWGEVVSYGELAALAGRPAAARAAGTFCAESRFALIVPCHRVVAANGIGGYGASGVWLKRYLLSLEGVTL